jgi:serine/threonine-protein kinase
MICGSSQLFRFRIMHGRLGPYEVQEPIGSGGMGEVYRGRDTRLERPVAIKVLKSATPSAAAQLRFVREGKAIAAVEHPHICAVYDVGHEKGLDYLVMQYLEGETLASRLRSGPLPLAEVLTFATQIAAAIAAAHDKGITHRDLKPSNVMLTKSGAMLLDFGLAKLNQVLKEDDVSVASTAEMTRDGTIVGTVRYMAPEVLNGGDADSCSDLFAYGALLYEMVTGRRPFEGDSDARVIAAILNEQPRPVRELRPDAPAALETLIEECLAKNPNVRLQNAQHIAGRLREIAGSRSTTRTSIPSSALRMLQRQPTWMAAVVAAGTLGVAATALFSITRPKPAPTPPPHLVALPCDAGDVPQQALCNGLADALIGRVVRLTQTHPLQVTPQLGGLTGMARNVRDARRQLGATRVVQFRPVAAGSITLTLDGDQTRAPLATQELAQNDENIFEVEERATAFLVRTLGLELTPAERDALVGRDTQRTEARLKYLEGRGRFVAAREAADFEAAIAAFATALTYDPNYAPAHAGLGLAWRGKYLSSRDTSIAAQAVNACREAVRRQPGLSLGHTCLGMLLYERRDLEHAAEELTRAVQADPTNDDAIVWLGRTQEELRLPSQAERTYLAAVKARPDYYNPRLWAANFYRRQSRYQDAADALAEAVRLVPDHTRLRAALAVPLNYVGRYEEAIAAARKANDLEPSPEALQTWGMSLYRLRRFEEAAAVIERALTLGRSDATLLSSLGRVYYWWGTPDARARALALLRDASIELERDATRPSGRLPKADVRIALADCYAKLERPDDAKKQLQQVGLNIDSPDRPTDSHQLFFAALVYAQLEERDTAIKWLERAVYWGVPRAELRAWPELDTLRNDRTFQSLLGVK